MAHVRGTRREPYPWYSRISITRSSPVTFVPCRGSRMQYAFIFAFFEDATASTVDPLRPYHATRLSNRPRRLSRRSVFAQSARTGAQQRSRPRMGRGGACRAVRAAQCASLLTWLALVARAEGEVATYSGTSISGSPRLASSQIWRATTERHPSRRAIAGERPSRSLSRASTSAHHKTPTLLPRRVPPRTTGTTRRASTTRRCGRR